jgi:hypothetical protein
MQEEKMSALLVRERLLLVPRKGGDGDGDGGDLKLLGMGSDDMRGRSCAMSPMQLRVRRQPHRRHQLAVTKLIVEVGG